MLSWISILRTTFFSTCFILLFVSPYDHVDSAGNSPVYRFYSEAYKSHFYTASDEEMGAIIDNDDNWCYEGAAYYLPEDVPVAETRALYRFYSSEYKSHFYTASESEKKQIIEKDLNWRYEGIAFRIGTKSSSARPLFRFYSPVFRSHFYTISELEKQGLIDNDPNWQYEGIAYYANTGPALRPETLCARPLPVGALGPDVSVGLDEYERDDVREDGVTVTSTNVPFNILDRDSKVIASLASGTEVEVRYDEDGFLLVDWLDSSSRHDKEVFFVAQQEADEDKAVFAASRKDGLDDQYDQFRGSMKLRYSKSTRRVWLINTLPLEHYVWGIGEITATGPVQYNELMTMAFRTYAYWKIVNSTKFLAQGFTVLATPANQIYRGYLWEQKYPRIREAALTTRGQIATYDGSVILLPFSSWTDGKTRHYTDGHWSGNCVEDPRNSVSEIFPYLISVDDSWGKHPTSDTCALAAGGNHMVGISANGALKLADDEGWDAQKIYRHYITGGILTQQY
jgi:hypothetical protein